MKVSNDYGYSYIEFIKGKMCKLSWNYDMDGLDLVKLTYPSKNDTNVKRI